MRLMIRFYVFSSQDANKVSSEWVVKSISRIPDTAKLRAKVNQKGTK